MTCISPSLILYLIGCLPFGCLVLITCFRVGRIVIIWLLRVTWIQCQVKGDVRSQVSHLQFLGPPEQPGSVRESACAPHPRHVRLHISCHNLSSDKFAYHAPPASFWAYQLFAVSSFGGWVMPPIERPRPRPEGRARVGLELTGDSEEENC